MEASALVLIVDIYGFAHFMKPEAVFTDPIRFMATFRDIVRKYFDEEVFFNELEGGAMIVRELPRHADTGPLLNEFLAITKQVDADFKRLLAQCADEIKLPASLRLDWSIVRGALKWADDAVPRDAPCGRPVSTYGAIRICARSPAAAA